MIPPTWDIRGGTCSVPIALANRPELILPKESGIDEADGCEPREAADLLWHA